MCMHTNTQRYDVGGASTGQSLGAVRAEYYASSSTTTPWRLSLVPFRPWLQPFPVFGGSATTRTQPHRHRIRCRPMQGLIKGMVGSGCVYAGALAKSLRRSSLWAGVGSLISGGRGDLEVKMSWG